MRTRPPRTRRTPILLLAALVAASCGDDGGTEPPPPVSVSVSPATATVGAAGTQTLTASVANGTSGAVTWSATGGTVDGSGASVTWTAPVEGGSYTVTATSTDDPSARGTATLTVTPVQVSVAPAGAALLLGEPTAFTAAVTGTAANTGVTWAATCGTVDADGDGASYRAPDAPGPCDVTATSELDPTVSSTVSVTVRPARAVTSEGDANDGACTWDHCTLREAILAANDGAPIDTVYLSTAAAGAPTRPVPGSGTGPVGGAAVRIEASLPTLTTELAIVGEGAELSEIDLQESGRAFDVSAAAGPARLVLRGLTVRDAVAAGGAAVYVRDGAVFEGTDLVLTGNRAVDAEGGAMVVAGTGTAAVLADVVFEGNRTETPGWPGGALSVVGGASLEMTGGAFRGNSSRAWGGAVRGINPALIHFDGTVFENNSVAPGGFGGGALFIESPGEEAGVVVLDDVVIRTNTVQPTGVGGGGGGAFFRQGLDLTIRGTTVEGNDAGPEGWGGGIHLGATAATITGSTLTGNAARIGGGVFLNDAEATIDDTAIDGNEGLERAGGVFMGITSSLTATGGSISDNTAGDLGGAGIFAQADATLSLDRTVLVGNETAAGGGGGISLFGNAVLTGTDIELRDNRASAGGGLFIIASESSLATLVGGIVDGNEVDGEGFSGGGIFADGGGRVVLEGTTVSNNVVADGSGGGLFALSGVRVEIDGGTFADNQAAVSGGGLWLRGPSTVANVVVRGNVVGANGGGASVASGTTIEASTFVANVAGSRGGGIFSVRNGAGVPRIVNGTFSGNAAELGGGLATLGLLEVVHVSVVGNSATGAGGGAYVYTTGDGSIAGDLNATNALFASNVGAGGAPESCRIDAGTGGAVTSGGGNVTDDTTCGFGQSSDLSGVEAGVAEELADNGGPTPTHALLAGSPALDAGVDAGIGTDQRGSPRDDGAPDAGAVEGAGG